jgi:protein arginine kinase activator
MACSVCGSTLQDVLLSRTAGCGECYRAFGDKLDETLRERHAGLKHRGKTPQLDDERARIRADLQAKRALLRSALKEENYEEAAVLRDSIAKLEEEQAAALSSQEA